MSRCDVFVTFYGVTVEGCGARLTATDTTVHHSAMGFLARCGGHAVVERCAVTAPGQNSYHSWDFFCPSGQPLQGSESRMYVSNSVAAYSGACDLRPVGGLMFSRGNNTSVENAFTCSPPTAFNPR